MQAGIQNISLNREFSYIFEILWMLEYLFYPCNVMMGVRRLNAAHYFRAIKTTTYNRHFCFFQVLMLSRQVSVLFLEVC